MIGGAGKASATFEAAKGGFGLLIRDSRDRVVGSWTYTDVDGSALMLGSSSGHGKIDLLTANSKNGNLEKGESRLTMQSSDGKGEVRLFTIPGGFNSLLITDSAENPRVRVATHGTKLINVIE